MLKTKKEVSIFRSALPIISLFLLILVGVIIMPQLTATMTEVTDSSGTVSTVKEPGEAMPLELVFIFATIISIANLFSMGFKWKEIENEVVKKVAKLVPAAMILFSIGLIVGSWVFSGTIPMLIYYGVDLINPNYIYLVAFIVPSIFSILTGTSWGSAGTIGVVLLGIAAAIDANLAIVAGAVVGGAYFGDKMSPLSDTTNIAALAADVPLMDHIRSMINTTGPAYILAAITYAIIGFTTSINSDAAQLNDIVILKNELSSLFNFSNLFLIIIILIPIIIVLYGSFTKKPTVPTLIVSSIIAALIGVFLHGFSFEQMLAALNTGFDTSLVFPDVEINKDVTEILNRGGLYSMVEPVIISIMVFIFVGTLDCIDAIPNIINKSFAWIKSRPQAIISSLFATGLTNALTSNQFATSYIIAEAFRPIYSKFKIPRKVLSRSIEDYGTMIENLLPWTTTGVFMFGALGVSALDYWKFQFVSLYGFVIAIILALTGIGCFYNEKRKTAEKGE
ncbi:Na+/H+ antiporter NhaC [Bacillus sp. SD088]|uniref:Na+/H+ antiporter NhaC n=1 Tax=Bacillus sp. SD088 TaxID=2782012 RepID=UPI001A957327|nr:Na+/H+ antiporter NhaC [Bacillus sp. SD088]MBO0993103.1 Na+/H+ antiporter NhaC [Bacillus sp. SD088]